MVELDVTFAVRAHAAGHPMTGVSRNVVESVRALVARRQFDIQLTSRCAADPYAIRLLMDDWASTTGLPDPAAGLRDRRSLAELLARDLYGPAPRARRAERIALGALRRARWRRLGDTSDGGLLHSFFDPLPMRSSNDQLRLLTVYDLIPMTHPGLTTAAERPQLDAILGSIRPERDWVLAISDHTRRVLIDATGLDEERVRIAPLAASDSFRPESDPRAIGAVRSRYGIPSGPYVLSLAQMTRRKNLGVVLDAFAAVSARSGVPRATLVLAGRLGGDVADLRQRIEEHRGLRDRVHLTGFVDDDDLAALYSGARAFVFPSLTEGFGLPPLEAMRCGLPVLASNAGAIPEVVGDAGILLDPHDPEPWIEALDRLLTDDAHRAEVAERCGARARTFSWSATATHTVRCYSAMGAFA